MPFPQMSPPIIPSRNSSSLTSSLTSFFCPFTFINRTIETLHGFVDGIYMAVEIFQGLEGARALIMYAGVGMGVGVEMAVKIAWACE